MKSLLLALSAIISIPSFAQSIQDTTWNVLKPLVGKWSGESEGQPGRGTYERTYELVLNNRFIEVRNRSMYPPTERNPTGEVHEDRGFMSYDKRRKTFVLRQFHIEGFVNQYRIEPISADKKTIVFISENIENIPSGFQAKETYQIINNDEFVETFELAAPGKQFEIYSKAILKRVK